MSDVSRTVHSWWLSPGPIAFGALVLVACVAVGWQGFAEARKPVDVRQRDVQSLKGSAFCDTPTPSASTAAPPAGSTPAADPAGPQGR